MNPFTSKEKQKKVSLVNEYVCNIANIPVKKLYSKSRVRDISATRFMAWYILRIVFKFSVPEIAKEFKKNNSAVLYGINSVKKTKTGDDVIVNFRATFPQY